jgi:hypothetical protein
MDAEPYHTSHNSLPAEPIKFQTITVLKGIYYVNSYLRVGKSLVFVRVEKFNPPCSPVSQKIFLFHNTKATFIPTFILYIDAR